MGVKPDHWIIQMARQHAMIEPFSEKLVSEGRISFGPSSYGYDFRLADRFKIFRGSDSDILDPKESTRGLFEDHQGDSCVVPAGSFVLAQSLEYFRIPRDVVTVCFGKSTYARCGILVNVTPFEPEWEGFVTISISNTGPSPVRIYAKEGIAQVLFLAADETCSVSYKDRKGKYQAQQGIALPKLKPGGSEAD